MIRKSVSLLITEKDDKFIKEFILDNPIINSYPKFISHAINQYIRSLKIEKVEDNEEN